MTLLGLFAPLVKDVVKRKKEPGKELFNESGEGEIIDGAAIVLIIFSGFLT